MPSSRLVDSLQSCPHPYALCQDLQRPQLRLVVVDKTRVLPLTGVECLAAGPIRPQTQVMIPILEIHSHRSFQRSDDTNTITTREEPEGFLFRTQEHPAAASKPQQAGSHNVTILSASLWKQRRDHESVDSRAGSQEIGANVDRELAVPTVFSSQSETKRDPDENVAHSMR